MPSTFYCITLLYVTHAKMILSNQKENQIIKKIFSGHKESNRQWNSTFLQSPGVNSLVNCGDWRLSRKETDSVCPILERIRGNRKGNCFKFKSIFVPHSLCQVDIYVNHGIRDLHRAMLPLYAFQLLSNRRDTKESHPSRKRKPTYIEREWGKSSTKSSKVVECGAFEPRPRHSL